MPATYIRTSSFSEEQNIIFRDELSMDLMFFDGKAVLHIVDTRFRAATFLDSNGEINGQLVEGV